MWAGERPWVFWIHEENRPRISISCFPWARSRPGQGLGRENLESKWKLAEATKMEKGCLVGKVGKQLLFARVIDGGRFAPFHKGFEAETEWGK